MRERLKRLEQLLTDPFKPEEVLKELEELLKEIPQMKREELLELEEEMTKIKGNFGKKLSHCLRLAGRTSKKDQVSNGRYEAF
jgi:hypothetical protein